MEGIQYNINLDDITKYVQASYHRVSKVVGASSPDETRSAATLGRFAKIHTNPINYFPLVNETMDDNNQSQMSSCIQPDCFRQRSPDNPLPLDNTDNVRLLNKKHTNPIIYPHW